MIIFSRWSDLARRLDIITSSAVWAQAALNAITAVGVKLPTERRLPKRSV